MTEDDAVVPRLYPEASWWIKYDRGKKHLSDLKVAIAPYTAGRIHQVTSSRESKRKPGTWTYRVWFDAPDPHWAAVFGDFLFNLRAALDHIAVALNPPQYKNKLIYFPINRDDPWRRKPGTRRYVERDSEIRKRFLVFLNRVKEPAAALIYICQPFVRAEVEGANAEDHSLAVLKELNDADKHRRLLVGLAGINGARVRYERPDGTICEEGYDFPPDAAARSGAKLFTLPYKVDVELMGSLAIGFSKRTEWVRSEIMWDYIDATVSSLLVQLEPHLLTPPSVPDHPTPPGGDGGGSSPPPGGSPSEADEPPESA